MDEMIRKYQKTNLHTHTLFCDGKATPEQMVLTAIEKEITILGFSSHSMYPFSSDWHLNVESHGEYAETIRSLKEKYANQIEILLGFEADYIPGFCCPRFDRYAEFAPDFLIGSVHYVYSEKGAFTVDNNTQELLDGIERVFAGSVKKAVGAYFAAQREMLSQGDFTIIGHPDLIRKFNNKLSLFDEKDFWYRREIKSLADAIKRAGVIAEINTGAIARGYQTKPYPSDEFLSLLHERNVPITINSDAHAPDQLDYAFDLARDCAKKAGYREFCIPRAGSLDFFSL